MFKKHLIHKLQGVVFCPFNRVKMFGKALKTCKDLLFSLSLF